MEQSGLTLVSRDSIMNIEKGTVKQTVSLDKGLRNNRYPWLGAVILHLWRKYVAGEPRKRELELLLNP